MQLRCILCSITCVTKEVRQVMHCGRGAGGGRVQTSKPHLTKVARSLPLPAYSLQRYSFCCTSRHGEGAAGCMHTVEESMQTQLSHACSKCTNSNYTVLQGSNTRRTKSCYLQQALTRHYAHISRAIHLHSCHRTSFQPLWFPGTGLHTHVACKPCQCVVCSHGVSSTVPRTSGGGSASTSTHASSALKSAKNARKWLYECATSSTAHISRMECMASCAAAAVSGVLLCLKYKLCPRTQQQQLYLTHSRPQNPSAPQQSGATSA